MIETATVVGADEAAAQRVPPSAADGLPGTSALLSAGGDTRIEPDPLTLRNGYGCPSTPDEDCASLGSSTASAISPNGFAAADRLHDRIATVIDSARGTPAGRAESDRIRQTLAALLDVSDLVGDDVVLAASGTDVHLIAAQLIAAGASQDLLVVVVEAAETGSGVAAALGGRYFSARTARGHDVVKGAPIPGARTAQVVEVPIRAADGAPLPSEHIGAEVSALVCAAVGAGRHVLVVVTDVSKTGMIAPPPDSLHDLSEMPGVDVLVDACQMRLGFDALRTYLECGWMVAITGSKFIGGPSFSGALLIPKNLAGRLRSRPIARGLADFSSACDWPRNWPFLDRLRPDPNWGLLLRWEAAMAELRAFRMVPGAVVRSILQEFEQRIEQRIARDPTFERLATPPLARAGPADSAGWGQVATIVPLLLFGADSSGERRPLDRDETARVWRLLEVDLGTAAIASNPVPSGGVARRRFRLGQPAYCGTRAGTPLAALRLCTSARLVAAAAGATGRDREDVFARAIAALDKIALIVETRLYERHED